MYALLLALIYLAFISLGLPDSLLGAGWAVMHVEMGASVSSMGVLTMIISGSTIVSSLFSDKLTKKLGTRVVTVVSVFLTVVGLLGFCFSNKYYLLAISSIPYGLGAGAIDASLNNYIALHYSAKHMSWLHCFWGVGAIVSPFIMGYSLANISWRGGYFIVACIQIVIGFILLATLPVWKVNPIKEAEQKGSVGVISALKIKGVPLILLGFFAYCAAEATTMQWASTYFVQVKSLSAEKAANLASLFYIGMTAGRFVAGFVSDRLGDKKMIIIGTCILFLGLILLALPVRGTNLAIAGFLIIGLGCAPIYPSIVHSTPGNFGLASSGAIISIQIAFAYVGNTFMPPLYGLLGSKIGFSIMPFYLIFFFALMILFTMLTFKVCKKKSESLA